MCKGKSRRYVLDRFEEGKAVMIGDDGLEVIAQLPGAREGDVFEMDDAGVFVHLPGEAERRRQDMRRRMDSIFKKPE